MTWNKKMMHFVRDGNQPIDTKLYFLLEGDFELVEVGQEPEVEDQVAAPLGEDEEGAEGAEGALGNFWMISAGVGIGAICASLIKTICALALAFGADLTSPWPFSKICHALPRRAMPCCANCSVTVFVASGRSDSAAPEA